MTLNPCPLAMGSGAPRELLCPQVLAVGISDWLLLQADKLGLCVPSQLLYDVVTEPVLALLPLYHTLPQSEDWPLWQEQEELLPKSLLGAWGWILGTSPY